MAAKSRAPRTSLGTFVAAAYGLDLLWPVLVLAGVEWFRIDPAASAFTPLAFEHYPWSHSLVTSLLWGGLAGTAYWFARRDQAGAVLVGAVVVSHWVLDAVVHVPDLPLWPGESPLVGLGLWNNVSGTFVVEGALFVAGCWLYLRHTPPATPARKRGLWALVAVVAVIWASGPFAPPPPSPTAVAVTALAIWLFVAWSAWVDRE
ncbi:MAG: hypothetical protein ABR551_00480 [Gemmatimonadales bacterium]